MLKPFHVLPCDVDAQQVIADRVVSFLQTDTQIFDQLDQLPLWNKIDTVALIRAVPELAQYFRRFDLRLKEVAVTVCNNNQPVSLHIDELPVVAKINFPILNTQGSRNCWYRVPDQLMREVSPIINKFGAAYYDLSGIDLAQCEKIGEVEISTPVVFNSQIAHMIDLSQCTAFPRLVLTCMFFNEPVDFLKD